MSANSLTRLRCSEALDAEVAGAVREAENAEPVFARVPELELNHRAMRAAFLHAKRAITQRGSNNIGRISLATFRALQDHSGPGPHFLRSTQIRWRNP